jgi:hypothetical protein
MAALQYWWAMLVAVPALTVLILIMRRQSPRRGMFMAAVSLGIVGGIALWMGLAEGVLHQHYVAITASPDFRVRHIYGPEAVRLGWATVLFGLGLLVLAVMVLARIARRNRQEGRETPGREDVP